jgi:DNA-binding GntR family transcriptional regulator
MTIAIFSGDDVAVPRPARFPYLVLADVLRERLDHGEWLPGEQLPSAETLAEQYSVSPTTAAKAVRVLAEEGRVNVVRRWGAFVAER